MKSVGRLLGFGVALSVALAACGSSDVAVTATSSGSTTVPTTPVSTALASPAATTTTGAVVSSTAVPTEGCADVIAATIEATASGFKLSATVSSSDTGWDKYADLWQVQTAEGLVLGERVLTHPHETEQPFTRSLTGVDIPTDVGEVVIAARDSVAGFCGAVTTVEVPHQ